MKSHIPFFRLIAFIEGISYLLLFGVSMPLKYLADMPEPNIWIGYAHGLLFMVYALLAALVCVEKKWGILRYFIFFVAALLPLGTFYIDKKYLSPKALSKSNGY
ncbi:MAG: DUF3817 domain-containing protein [Flavobacteriaceae bacterium]|nr:DUF3817 domain-containing protein [Flavobacteriaceae bacterium]